MKNNQPSSHAPPPLKNVPEKLPFKQFVRTHSGYIVPISNNRSFLNHRITLHSGAELPVGNRYVDGLKTLLK